MRLKEAILQQRPHVVGGLRLLTPPSRQEFAVTLTCFETRLAQQSLGDAEHGILRILVLLGTPLSRLRLGAELRMTRSSD